MSGSPLSPLPLPCTFGTAWWRLCLSFHHFTLKPCDRLPKIKPKHVFHHEKGCPS